MSDRRRSTLGDLKGHVDRVAEKAGRDQDSSQVYVTKRQLIIAGALVGFGMALALVGVLLIALQINDLQSAQLTEQRERLAQNERALDRIENLEDPSPERIREGVRRALRELAKDERLSEATQRALRELTAAGRQERQRGGGRSSGSSGPSKRSPRRGAGRERERGGAPGQSGPPSSPPAAVTQPSEPPPSPAPAPAPPEPERPRPAVDLTTPESVPLPEIEVCTPVIGVNCP
ncbi:MAG TPA: hypothetical protein VF192_00990 [Longimicrobiales bacterium]